MGKTLKIAGGVLAAAVVLGGIGVGRAWAPDRPVESLTARWATGASRFVPIDGMQAHVRDEGPIDDAEPIILLHGTSASLHTWDGWTQAIKGQHRVIRVDLPGSARSQSALRARASTVSMAHLGIQA